MGGRIVSTSNKPSVVDNPNAEKGQLSLLPTYGESFLDHHAGRVIADPAIAIVELVANCSDAGADRVEIVWPKVKGEQLSVADNGTGMTHDEFTSRWRELNYDRQKVQGVDVVFPKGVRHRARVAFGRNGIGRHAMFCFASEYLVETRKEGRLERYLIRRRAGNSPFDIDHIKSDQADTTGTTISCAVENVQLTPENVADLIGTQFVADPEFNISVNGQQVTLTDIEHLCDRYDLPVGDLGVLPIRRFDGERAGRTSKHHGVAFWVNGRLCGVPSWDVFDRPILDARRAAARRFTYVVEVDLLAAFVKPDWTGFYATQEVNEVRQRVQDFITENLREVLHEIRRERKREALGENRQMIRRLPPTSQETIAAFVDEVQIQCPTITERDLSNAVEVLAKLERARSGYDLLERLGALQPADLDKLDSILEDWTVSDIKRVLGELRYRLDLIAQLEKLVDARTTDELHDLQPIFERGLWIFGPEFESVSFVSNRSLATVVQEFFSKAALRTPRRRPDFVALPDTSIGVYSCDGYDEGHEVAGFSKVVIVELKKGGFEISGKEKNQAMDYARELRRSGKIGLDTPIVCHVLGSTVDPVSSDVTKEGATSVHPRTYVVLLRAAHARTFNLLKDITSTTKWRATDEDLNAVLDADATPLLDRAVAT
jgi:hypothetical protein